MKNIYIRNLVSGYLKKKKTIVICFIIFVLIFGALGVRQAYPEKVSSSLSEEVAEYQSALDTYDQTIATIQKNIETVQGQVELQENYCEESVLMQIDPSEVQTASVQYVIQAEGLEGDAEDVRVTNAINNITAYITSGGVKTQIAQSVSNDLPVQYLSELVSSTVAGNTLTITAKHYDMEVSRAIIEAIQNVITEHKDAFVSAVGDFNITQTDYSETTAADLTVQNTQNTQLNNLRTYRNTLSDLQTKLITQQTARNNYEQQYKPAGVNTESPKKTLVKYAGLGVIAGILLPLVIYAVWYTFSNRLKGKEELMAEGLNILAAYNPKTGYTPDLGRAVLDLELLADTKQASAICLCGLGQSERIPAVIAEMQEAIKGKETFKIQMGQESPEEMRRMVEMGNCVLFAEAGATTYTQIEEQVQLCQRYRVSVWGCVVIE